MLRCAVVILNWNGKKYLQDFLPILIRHTAYLEDVELVVADNNSTDDSISYIEANHADIRIIRLDKNYGFAEGYNRALSQIDARFYVLLNSDVEVSERWLEPLLEVMESDERIAACQPKIRSWYKREAFEYAGAAGGYLDKWGYPYCRGRLFDTVEEDKGQYDIGGDIFWASGACMVVRADVYEEFNGLDGQFFAHMEEIDLCWRMKRAGYRLQYVHNSMVFHIGGGSLPVGSERKLYLNYRNSLLMLWKNLPKSVRKRRIFERRLLDGISAAYFIFKGEFKAIRAIWRAHRDFEKQKHKYTEPANDYDEVACGVHSQSIVFNYFLSGKRKFSQL